MINPECTTASASSYVCALTWNEYPGQACILPPLLQADDDFRVPLQFTSRSSLGDGQEWTRSPILGGRQYTDGRCSNISLCRQSLSRALSRQTNDSPSSQEAPLTPNGPAVSPCSDTSTDRETGWDAIEEEFLLHEVLTRVPCIETGRSVMASWSDIKEIFFPRCSGTHCNIVENALKLQLKHPHIPSFIHPCSVREQMTFLQQNLHLVPRGTLLVDLEVFLKHMNILQVMVEAKHFVTRDVRSLSCDYTGSHLGQRQKTTLGSPQGETSPALPALVILGKKTVDPLEAADVTEALVPLSLLPYVFPRHQKQFLFVATKFVTRQSGCPTRMCSVSEARLLNSCTNAEHHFITSSDLLMKWQDVVTLVDPLGDHVGRVQPFQTQRSEQVRPKLELDQPQAQNSQPEKVVANLKPKHEYRREHNCGGSVAEPSDMWFSSEGDGARTSGRRHMGSGGEQLSTATAVSQKLTLVSPAKNESPAFVKSHNSMTDEDYIIKDRGTRSCSECVEELCLHLYEARPIFMTAPHLCASGSSTSFSSSDSVWDSDRDTDTKVHEQDDNETDNEPIQLAASENNEVSMDVSENSTKTFSGATASNVKSPKTVRVETTKETPCIEIQKSEQIPFVDENGFDEVPEKCMPASNNFGRQRFKNIADLFTILSHEEVSHRSQKLASDEIKTDINKTRMLGDLSGKGLQTLPKSESIVPVVVPKTEDKLSCLKSEDTELTLSQVDYKNRNKYPQMSIEAKKCNLDEMASKITAHRKPALVTDILDGMDKTFKAYKPDPIALAKAKLTAPPNTTGYVNTDYIRVTGPSSSSSNDSTSKQSSPNRVKSLKHLAHVASSEKEKTTTMTSTANQQYGHRTKANEISSLLKDNNVKQYSILETKRPPIKLKLQLKPLSIGAIDDKGPEDESVKVTVTEKGETTDTASLSSSAVGVRQPLCSASKKPIRPKWNVKKVLTKSERKRQNSLCSKRNAKMNADFIAMKERALARNREALRATSSATRPEHEENPVLQKSKRKRNDNHEGVSVLSEHRENHQKCETSHADDGRSGRKSVSKSQDQLLNTKSFNKGSPKAPSVGHADQTVSTHNFSADNVKVTAKGNTQLCSCVTPVLGTCNESLNIRYLVPVCVNTPSLMAKAINTPSVDDNRQLPGLNHYRSQYAERDPSHFRSAMSLSNVAGSRGKQVLSRPFTKDPVRSVHSTNTSQPHINSMDTDREKVKVKNLSLSLCFKPKNECPSVTVFSENEVAVKNKSECQFVGQSCSGLQQSHGKQRALASVECPINKGGFLDKARVSAASNIHNIMRMGSLHLHDKGHRSYNHKSRNQNQFASGESIVWSQTQRLLAEGTDKNQNNLSVEDNRETDLRKSKDEAGKEKGYIGNTRDGCKQTGNSFEDENDNSMSDVECLIANTISSLGTVRKCLNRNENSLDTNNNSTIDKKESPHMSISAAKTSSEILVDEQPVYPCYGSMICDEPIKKNILLRETLKNNFHLIKQISKCICSCKDVFMLTKPGDRLPCKKFLKNRYLQSVRHCPLHSETTDLSDQQGVLHFIDMLHKPVQKNKRRSKVCSRRGKRSAHTKRLDLRSRFPWFQDRAPLEKTTIPLREQIYQTAAREYLASYTFHHYKKELLTRYLDEKGNGFPFPRDNHLISENREKKGAKTSKRKVRGMFGSRRRKASKKNNVSQEQKKNKQNQDNVLIQQQLFMRILTSVDPRASFSKQESDFTNTEVCKNSDDDGTQSGHKSVEDHKHSVPKTTNSSVEEQTVDTLAVNTGLQSDVRFCPVLMHDNPASSYHGTAYISGLAIPYVIHNGFKYILQKQAPRLFPGCRCLIVLSVLKKCSSLTRTFCVWEQVQQLDSLLDRSTNVSTGDALLRLDTLLTQFAEIDMELGKRHQASTSKRSNSCRYKQK